MDVKDDDGRTPVHYACAGGALSVLKFLIEHLKLPVDVTSNDGETPLDVALDRCHTEVAEYLKSLPKVTSDPLSSQQTPSPTSDTQQPQTTDAQETLTNNPSVSAEDDGTSTTDPVSPDTTKETTPTTLDGDNTIIAIQLTVEEVEAFEKLLLDKKIKKLNKKGKLSFEVLQQHLRDHEQEELAADLRAQLDKKIEELRKISQRLDDLMIDQAAIDTCSLRVFMVGPPFVGKTTTLNRLLRVYINISTGGEKAKLRSTLFSNCTQVVAYVSKDATKWVSSKNRDEEAKIIFGYMYGNKLQKEEKKTADQPIDKPVEDHTPTSRAEEEVDSSEVKHKPSPEKPHKSAYHDARAERRVAAYQQNRLLPIKARLQKLIKSGDYTEMASIIGNTLLNINDVGGQPGFLEMLPALSSGPAMYLVFMDLSKDLNKPYVIPFSRDGIEITPFDAIYTVEATLSQILSSIASIHRISRGDNLYESSKLGELFKKFQSVRPVAALIGTHVDKLKNPKERIKQVNEALKPITEKFAKILVTPPPHFNSSFFAVDNFEGTEEADIAPIRDFMSKTFQSHFKNASLKIKPKWLILGTLLRREYQIVKMDDCLEVGRMLEMDEEETEFCLYYLHCIGSLMWYTRVSNDDDDWLKNHVICSPQVIFHSISQLILASLRTLHSKGHVTEYERAELIKLGQFSVESIEKYCAQTESTQEKLKEEEIIPARQLITLLEYLNLLSPIFHKDENGSTRVTYLMPAILECASQEELISPPQPDDNNPEPLHLTFSFGYVPTGVFCSLITRLVSEGPQGILGLTWELVEEGVKRNCISFRIDDVHKVMLLSHARSYEIRVIRKDPDVSLHYICSYVLSAILYVLKSLFQHLVSHIAFQYSCCAHSGEPVIHNLCVLSAKKKVRFLCEQSKEPITLKPGQRVWLGKHVTPKTSASLEVLKFAEDALDNFSFHWTKEGSNRQIKTSDDAPNVLSFQSVSEKDFGYYQCDVKEGDKVILTINAALYKEDSGAAATGAGISTTPDLCITEETEPISYNAEQDATPIHFNDRSNYLRELRTELWDLRAEWYDLGIELRMAVGTCDAIDKANSGRSRIKDCFTSLLQDWLSNDPQLSDLFNALNSPVIDRADLAAKLREKIESKELVLW